MYDNQTTIWDILTALGTVGSCVIALGIALYSNRNKTKSCLKFSKYDILDKKSTIFSFNVYNFSDVTNYMVEDRNITDIDNKTIELDWNKKISQEYKPHKNTEDCFGYYKHSVNCYNYLYISELIKTIKDKGLNYKKPIKYCSKNR
ncbi:MAG: hypothetical protein ACK5N8_08535 [Alphaproteobacteria bacterium]